MRGGGVVYHKIKKGFIEPENVYWHIVDSEKMINIGKKYQGKEDSRLFFYHNKDHIGQYDILHISTSLQYIRDYKMLLADLLQGRPKYCIFTRLLYSNVQTYITAQEIYGRTTPCVFISIDEFIYFMKTKGYCLIFLSKETRENLIDYYDKSIPVECRIPFSINVVFVSE